jgi:hypothetical protein
MPPRIVDTGRDVYPSGPGEKCRSCSHPAGDDALSIRGAERLRTVGYVGCFSGALRNPAGMRAVRRADWTSPCDHAAGHHQHIEGTQAKDNIPAGRTWAERPCRVVTRGLMLHRRQRRMVGMAKLHRTQECTGAARCVLDGLPPRRDAPGKCVGRGRKPQHREPSPATIMLAPRSVRTADEQTDGDDSSVGLGWPVRRPRHHRFPLRELCGRHVAVPSRGAPRRRLRWTSLTDNPLLRWLRSNGS